MPIVDLHCHSSVSDGLLPPEEVARLAEKNNVDIFALTDHDELAGLRPAAECLAASKVRFITGVEISIEWLGAQVHIVGLDFDESSEALNLGLSSIRDGRVVRARKMAESLERLGIAGVFEGAMKYAGNPKLIGRAHFARYLVELGVCKDVRSVFDSYLVPGKPGYVQHCWPTLADAVSWIHGAGGFAVIAHPGRYAFKKSEMKRLFAEFRDLGGDAIEVISGSHSNDDITTFARVAREYGFKASCGSDFHGPGESYVELGKLPVLPVGVVPVWELFK